MLKKGGMVEGLTINETPIPSRTCEACIQAKQAHAAFPQEAQNRAKIPGERTLSDVWGPAHIQSIGKWYYYISFTDDKGRYVGVRYLKKKSDSYDRIIGHVNMLERQYGHTPKFLRFDNGKELVNEKLKK